MKDFGVKARLAGFSAIPALLCVLVVPHVAGAQGTASSLIVKLVSGLSSDQQAVVRSSYQADPQVERVEENTARSSEVSILDGGDAHFDRLTGRQLHHPDSATRRSLLRTDHYDHEGQAMGGGNLQVHEAAFDSDQLVATRGRGEKG